MDITITQNHTPEPMCGDWQQSGPSVTVKTTVQRENGESHVIGLVYTLWRHADGSACHCLGRTYFMPAEESSHVMDILPEGGQWGPRARASTMLAAFCRFREKQLEYRYPKEVQEAWPALISAAWGHLATERELAREPKNLTLF